MPKINYKILVFLSLLFIVLIVLQHFVPKPVNWELSFSGYKKTPYGCRVLRDMLPEFFQGKNIENNSASFYQTLNGKLSNDQNLIIISSELNADDLDVAALLEFAGRGNALFISSYEFSSKWCDTLQLELNHAVLDTSLFKKFVEHLQLNYVPEKADSGYRFKRRMPESFFIAYNDSTTEVLGTDRSGRPDFLHTPFGKGHIYLHCQPLAFTNYHLLYSNFQYAFAALSVLPVRHTIWDQYYKPGKVIDTSPVRYILSNTQLRSAWYILLFILAVYLLFGSKRRQRVIPVIVPLQNSSLGFIQSVGKLYYKSSNHADLAKKKISYLREFLKTRFHFYTSFSNDEELLILSQKSGVESVIIQRLSETILSLDNKDYIGAHDLKQLNQIIEEFYTYCK